ncbi:uncharacterized protein BDZ99DRAFT_481350 [Mytilinidion resinicola]|uniref:Uncharacterized protein n=1 Tax=Mytilinidion resinicola TaxID=574789 RepID=A0A6A6Y8N3_9PEZI|nr:uncharacterized protein BDZ99DRAFT_481350 [Mytilinidion resinicola]KAF2804177.1 hypothetical protein BDZ99DRAFT_481350 [Mytilinidion resinicola]
MSSLDSSLLDLPLSNDTKALITRHLWDVNNTQQQLNARNLELRAYWSYYVEECSHALHDAGRHISARTHRNVLDIVFQLRGAVLREQLRDSLRPALLKPTPPNEDELLDSSIDLAARLLLMLDFGNLQYGFSGRSQLDWDKGTLKDFVHAYFNTPPAHTHDGVKLEKTFNGRNLGRIAGIEIVWTNNLADHLRMTDDDTKVTVFHHASFLELQLQNPLFPPNLINETLRTLALLFPQSDPQTRKWSPKASALHSLDPCLAHCGHLKTDDRQISNFTFWHDRLVILKQVFDEARPRTLAQWWCDRRNGVQWYTFWVAIVVLVLTLFFGLVQCVEGALQVYYTMH